MAKLLDSIKVDKLFKALFYKARTSTDKEYYEETIPTTFDVHASEIYFESIPLTPPPLSDSVIKIHTGLALTQDRSVSGNRTWVVLPTWSSSWSSGSNDVTQIMKNFISPKYGSAYTVKVYKGDGTRISELDNVNWMFDYKAGVLTFESDPGMNGNSLSQSIMIDVFQYIGKTVLNSAGSSSLEGLTDVDSSESPPQDGSTLRYDGASSTWKPYVPTSKPILFESKIIPVDGERTIVSSKPFVVGDNSLMVFLNGLFQIPDEDYIEIDSNTISFNIDLNKDDKVTLRISSAGYAE